ncbi:hypothetical protein CXU03_07835 [Akkermansia muciniphila]|nr:hypothetical protein CXU03_07835 [Akkermansia muciniphila]
MLAFRSFPAPDSGEGFRKHLARFYRFEERMRRFTGGDEGKRAMVSVGTAYSFFLPLFCFWPIRAPPGAFLRQQSRSGVVPERLWRARRKAFRG